MTLKVIGAGFGRTGTMSPYLALKQLGFPCYHMIEVIGRKQNRLHLDFWNEVADGEPGAQHDWDRVFANYTVVVDNPACCVWRELMSAYPEAKVILTLHPRGADAWYESTVDTVYFTENMWQFKVLELVTSFARNMGSMSRKLIWQRSHRGTMSDRSSAIAYYQQHIDEVVATVPAERLLVYSVDQGWKPLCEFLDVPEPTTDFPSVNDRAAIKRSIRQIVRGAYTVLGAFAAAAAALVYGLVRVLAS
ncbi:MAG: sulfotransferase family protein [Parahaliea sp.]